MEFRHQNIGTLLLGPVTNMYKVTLSKAGR